MAEHPHTTRLIKDLRSENERLGQALELAGAPHVSRHSRNSPIPNDLERLMDNLRKALGLPRGKHDSTDIVRRATAEIERYEAALLWMADADPQLVDAARDKFWSDSAPPEKE